MKQTAVQWFATKVLNLNISPKQMHDFLEWFEQAKEIEKEQIKEAFIKGEENIDLYGCYENPNLSEQYYKENYENES